MEHKLRPGMITLTWTSMNIDSYIHHVHKGLKQLRELVSNINDIIENRIEKNLKMVSKTLLIDLPEDSSFTVSDFVSMQKIHIAKKAAALQGKNNEIESAVEDLIEQITAFVFESPLEKINPEDTAKLRDHYNHFMYKSLLYSAKNSMNALKKRIGSRGGSSILNSSKPFFNVDVQLMPPNVTLSPSLDQIQNCISTTAQSILMCYKSVIDWGYRNITQQQKPKSFFERITKDIELVRVALLLTGCIQGIRNTVAEYLNSFVKVRR
jgi:dynein heavy chain